MSAAVSATKDVPFNAHLEEDIKNKEINKVVNVGEADQIPYNDDAEGTDSEAEEDPKLELDLGPQCSLKEQLEKDKVTFLLQNSNVSSLPCRAFYLYVMFPTVI